MVSTSASLHAEAFAAPGKHVYMSVNCAHNICLRARAGECDKRRKRVSDDTKVCEPSDGAVPSQQGHDLHPHEADQGAMQVVVRTRNQSPFSGKHP